MKAIVVVDPAKHHAAEVDRHIKANLQHHLRQSATDAATVARVQARVEKAVKANIGGPKAVGDLVSMVETHECPEGLPNCPHCGDPDHAADCQAQGHCPDCGTKHGIAPQSYLLTSGVEVIDIPDDETAGVWEPTKKRFVKP